MELIRRERQKGINRSNFVKKMNRRITRNGKEYGTINLPQTTQDLDKIAKNIPVTAEQEDDLQQPTNSEKPKGKRKKREIWAYEPIIDKSKEESTEEVTNTGRPQRSSALKATHSITTTLWTDRRVRKTKSTESSASSSTINGSTIIPSDSSTTTVSENSLPEANSLNETTDNIEAEKYEVENSVESVNDVKNDEQDTVGHTPEFSANKLSSAELEVEDNGEYIDGTVDNTVQSDEITVVEEIITADQITESTLSLDLEQQETNNNIKHKSHYESSANFEDTLFTEMQTTMDINNSMLGFGELNLSENKEQTSKPPELSVEIADSEMDESVPVVLSPNPPNLTEQKSDSPENQYQILQNATPLIEVVPTLIDQQQQPQSARELDLSAYTTDESEAVMPTLERALNEPRLDTMPIPVAEVEGIPRSEWPADPSYRFTAENIMRCEDAVSSESKSIRCECAPDKHDKKEGRACGADCINRLLFMECRKCRSGKYCRNRRFQRQENAELERFFTGPKGWGLRAKKEITKGQFLIEYVGEVVDACEMCRRLRRYAKDPNIKHHYLMALRNGCVIDATVFGNESRFINHSCEPNAATQKWTVGNQLRIGFFAERVIKSGEEIVFDYQFQRFGRQAQSCYCESANCAGYIGVKNADELVQGELSEAEDDDRSTSSDSGGDGDETSGHLAVTSMVKGKKLIERKKKIQINRTKEAKIFKQHTIRRILSPEELKREMELAEVSEMLLKAKGTLRNQEQVLEFNRLMVRVDQMESRQRMVDFLSGINDINILRLFVANRGLALIRIWFMLPKFSMPSSTRLQINIAKLLLKLPVTTKNQVDEAHIMGTLQQMLQYEPPYKFVVEEVVQDLIGQVVFEIDGHPVNSPNNCGDEKAHRIHMAFDEVVKLKNHAKKLVDKWAKLLDFKIPKKAKQQIVSAGTMASSSVPPSLSSVSKKFFKGSGYASSDSPVTPGTEDSGGDFRNSSFQDTGYSLNQKHGKKNRHRNGTISGNRPTRENEGFGDRHAFHRHQNHHHQSYGDNRRHFIQQQQMAHVYKFRRSSFFYPHGSPPHSSYHTGPDEFGPPPSANGMLSVPPGPPGPPMFPMPDPRRRYGPPPSGPPGFGPPQQFYGPPHAHFMGPDIGGPEGMNGMNGGPMPPPPPPGYPPTHLHHYHNGGPGQQPFFGSPQMPMMQMMKQETMMEMKNGDENAFLRDIPPPPPPQQPQNNIQDPVETAIWYAQNLDAINQAAVRSNAELMMQSRHVEIDAGTAHATTIDDGISHTKKSSLNSVVEAINLKKQEKDRAKAAAQKANNNQGECKKDRGKTKSRSTTAIVKKSLIEAKLSKPKMQIKLLERPKVIEEADAKNSEAQNSSINLKREVTDNEDRNVDVKMERKEIETVPESGQIPSSKKNAKLYDHLKNKSPPPMPPSGAAGKKAGKGKRGGGRRKSIRHKLFSRNAILRRNREHFLEKYAARLHSGRNADREVDGGGRRRSRSRTRSPPRPPSRTDSPPAEKEKEERKRRRERCSPAAAKGGGATEHRRITGKDGRDRDSSTRERERGEKDRGDNYKEKGAGENNKDKEKDSGGGDGKEKEKDQQHSHHHGGGGNRQDPPSERRSDRGGGEYSNNNENRRNNRDWRGGRRGGRGAGGGRRNFGRGGRSGRRGWRNTRGGPFEMSPPIDEQQQQASHRRDRRRDSDDREKGVTGRERIKKRHGGSAKRRRSSSRSSSSSASSTSTYSSTHNHHHRQSSDKAKQKKKDQKKKDRSKKSHKKKHQKHGKGKRRSSSRSSSSSSNSSSTSDSSTSSDSSSSSQATTVSAKLQAERKRRIANLLPRLKQETLQQHASSSAMSISSGLTEATLGDASRSSSRRDHDTKLEATERGNWINVPEPLAPAEPEAKKLKLEQTANIETPKATTTSTTSPQLHQVQSVPSLTLPMPTQTTLTNKVVVPIGARAKVKLASPPVPPKLLMQNKVNAEQSEETSEVGTAPIAATSQSLASVAVQQNTPSVSRMLMPLPQPQPLTHGVFLHPDLVDAYLKSLNQFYFQVEYMKKEIFGDPQTSASEHSTSNESTSTANNPVTNVQQQTLQQQPISIVGKVSAVAVKREEVAATTSSEQKFSVQVTEPAAKRPRFIQEEITNSEENETTAVMALTASTSQTVPASTTSTTPPEDPRIVARAANNNRQGNKSITNAGPSQPTVVTTAVRLPVTSTVAVVAGANEREKNAQPVDVTMATNSVLNTTVDSRQPLQPSTTVTATTKMTTVVRPGAVSRSGNWLAAKDSTGNIYYYHRVTREAVWVLPVGEDVSTCVEQPTSNNIAVDSTFTKMMGNDLAKNQRRSEFKRSVSDLVAKLIEGYRKRFFPIHNDYVHFLRKVTHKVLDNQAEGGNVDLVFNETVYHSTKRLVDEYINIFKAHHSKAAAVAIAQHVVAMPPASEPAVLRQHPTSANSVISILDSSATTSIGQQQKQL